MSPPFPRWDFVHQISSLRYELARLAGHPDDRQMYIPIGSEIPASLSVPGLNIQAELRGKLGLPQNQLILLSVAAINASHKRLDYVVRELAALPGPRPFLVMLGQTDDETPPILDLANKLLGSEGYLARTVKRGEVEAFYSVSDLFVLASLNEGMGKVLVEALAHGLPCLAHDYPVTREVLGEFGNYADFCEPGNLTNLLRVVLRTGRSDEQRHSQHSYAYREFSWKFLREKYVAMLTQAAKVD